MKNKDNKGLLILLNIFIVITLLLGSYIIYDKFIKEDNKSDDVVDNNKKDDQNTTNDNKDNTGSSTTTDNTNKNIVIDSIGGTKKIKYAGTCLDQSTITANVYIPKINSDKKNAQVLNSKIVDDAKYVINEYNKEETIQAVLDIKYQYVVRDNIVYIYLVESYSRGCSSGSTTYRNYFYDIKNDKILNMEEGFREAGYDLDDLQMTAYKSWTFNYYCENNEVKVEDKPSPWDVTFKQCETNRCGCGLRIVKENLIPFYYQMCA